MHRQQGNARVDQKGPYISKPVVCGWLSQTVADV